MQRHIGAGRARGSSMPGARAHAVAGCRHAPYIAWFKRFLKSREKWRALPSKIVSSRSRTDSSWSCWPRSGRAKSPPARRCRSTATTTRTRSSRCARSPRRRSALEHLKTSVVRGMQKHVEIDEPEETHELELDPLCSALPAPVGALVRRGTTPKPRTPRMQEDEERRRRGERGRGGHRGRGGERGRGGLATGAGERR